MTKVKKRIAVIMGGSPYEYDNSLKSGRDILMHLNRDKYIPTPFIINEKDNLNDLISEIKEESDVAFISMHGEYGRSGKLQGELDHLSVPYTGSNPSVSALCFNKFLLLGVVKSWGFNIPFTTYIKRHSWQKNKDNFLRKLKLTDKPWVVRPNRKTSETGVSLINNYDDLEKVIESLLEDHKDISIHPYVQGRFISCGVLDMGVDRSGQALHPIEVAGSDPFVSKEENLTHLSLPDGWMQRIKRTAEFIHNNLGCSGKSKIDMVVDSKGIIHIIGVNTVPGLHRNSIISKGAELKSIEFKDLIDRIVESALRYHSVNKA